MKHLYRYFVQLFGPKMEEVAGSWRSLHNDELHNLYSSPDIINNTDKSVEMGA